MIDHFLYIDASLIYIVILLPVLGIIWEENSFLTVCKCQHATVKSSRSFWLKMGKKFTSCVTPAIVSRLMFAHDSFN